MAGFLTYMDGRLKTGRVTILVFAGLLVLMAVFFNINKSVDHALVAVKHVFEPKEIQPSKQTPPVSQKIVRMEPEKKEPVEEKKTTVPEKTQDEKKKEAEPAFDGKADKLPARQEIAEEVPAKALE